MHLLKHVSPIWNAIMARIWKVIQFIALHIIEFLVDIMIIFENANWCDLM